MFYLMTTGRKQLLFAEGALLESSDARVTRYNQLIRVRLCAAKFSPAPSYWNAACCIGNLDQIRRWEIMSFPAPPPPASPATYSRCTLCEARPAGPINRNTSSVETLGNVESAGDARAAYPNQVRFRSLTTPRAACTGATPGGLRSQVSITSSWIDTRGAPGVGASPYRRMHR